ncbi:MAG: prepilin-type N-terminal cleavage/methylation domain-containing protein [Luteolibacter sp.]
MKTQPNSPSKRGFTLMELMVAMAITSIIVTVLVSITSIALETWNRSRAELRASRQGKMMVDFMARDFESLVTRKGNANEWLSAKVDPGIATLGDAGKGLLSTNAAKLVFFTAATDRYNGNIGDATQDRGGDVSCVAYLLEYRDPIDGGGSAKYKTFVMNRLLVNPDDTFGVTAPAKALLGTTDVTTAGKSLDSIFSAAYPNSEVTKPGNFICENIYQFSLTFHVLVAQVSGAGTPSATTTLIDVPVTVGPAASGKTSDDFRMAGTGNIVTTAPTGFTPDEIKAGRVTAVEISVSVISDFGIDQMRTRSFSGSQQSEFLAKNSYQYTKLVQLPGM